MRASTGNHLRSKEQQPRVPKDARMSLLAAAETLLLDKGMPSISTRAICRLADTNVSQIRYYFGNLDGLLDEVLAAELGSVARTFDAVDLSRRHQTLGGLVDLLLDAVRAPAAFCPEGFAALAIEEIYRQISPESQRVVTERLVRAHQPYLHALSAFLPLLSADALRYRFSAMVALIMAMLPQSSGSRLFAIQRPRLACGQEWRDNQLRAICVGALEGKLPIQSAPR
jgi:AcrR family transcriptional regulator